MTLPSLAGAVDGWYDNTAPDPRWWRTTSGRDRRQPDVAHHTVGVTDHPQSRRGWPRGRHDDLSSQAQRELGKRGHGCGGGRTRPVL